MPRIAKVSDIKANLLRPATTSHFEVDIPIPNALRDKWQGVGKQDKINLMCSETVLPGSNLATFEIDNDRTGVTEKHVHRRIFDDRIDLTFYVDAGLYTPIRFFEQWISYITNGRNISEGDQDTQLLQPNYDYRIKYPDSYVGTGLKVTKFEKDQGNILEYEFTRVFPLAINSMPVCYDSSSLLKCTVSMSYVRYIVKNLYKRVAYPQTTPKGQAKFNAAGIAAGLVDAAVDRFTGNDFLGDVAGAVAGTVLGRAWSMGTDGIARDPATGEPF